MHIHATSKGLFDSVPTVRKAQTSSKADKQIPKSVKNQWKLVPKSILTGPKIDQNLSKNQPKSVPRPSWRGLGAILAPRWPKTTQRAPKSISLDPLGRPCWRPKSTKNRSGSDPKCDHFFIIFVNRFRERFGANLGPTWLPKPS